MNTAQKDAQNIIDASYLEKSKPLLTSYIKAAMNRKKIVRFPDGTYYAEIPECPGVWANEGTKKMCTTVLREVLEEWIMLKLMDKDPLNVIDGIEIGKVAKENCTL